MENNENPVSTTYTASTEEASKDFFSKMLKKGAITILPLLTISALFVVTFNFTIRLIAPISEFLNSYYNQPRWMFDILTLVLIFSIITGIGILVHNRKGKKCFKILEENFLGYLPLYNAVSGTIKQFSGQKEMPFKQVVLIDPFGTGSMMTGFVTEQISDEMYTIFVPTAPNPTNGNIFHVPTHRIKFISVSSEKAMRAVVGMGTGSKKLFFENVQDSGNKIIKI